MVVGNFVVEGCGGEAPMIWKALTI